MASGRGVAPAHPIKGRKDHAILPDCHEGIIASHDALKTHGTPDAGSRDQIRVGRRVDGAAAADDDKNSAAPGNRDDRLHREERNRLPALGDGMPHQVPRLPTGEENSVRIGDGVKRRLRGRFDRHPFATIG